jgi:hypothetical protein
VQAHVVMRPFFETEAGAGLLFGKDGFVSMSA